jgi:3-dehydrosphinganine reductase
MDFHHKHVIITGGSSGIGRAIARLLAERGAHISIIARRQELLDETLAELGTLRQDPAQRMMVYSADLSDWEQTKRAISALTADIPPDILINAAGFAHPGYFEELPLDIFHKTMDIDYFGTLYAVKAVLPSMMERRSGYIVNFSSIAGFLSGFGYTAYSAAKFAVRGFSDALRQELKPHGIHVSIVFPPDTDTPQLHYENQFKPLETRRLGGPITAATAEKVALTVVRGIERKKAVIIPSFDGQFYFLLFNGPTGLLRWYCDRVIAKTRRERKAS